MEIDKKELKLITVTVMFTFLWMMVIVPYLSTSKFFIGLIPPLQYIIYNSAYLALSVVVFGLVLSSMRRKEGWGDRILTGVCTLVVFSLVFDLLAAPYAYSTSGVGIVDSSGAGVMGAAPDFMVGWVYQQIGFSTVPFMTFPFTMSSVYVLTYVFTPIFVIFIVTLVLEPGVVLRLVRSGK